MLALWEKTAKMFYDIMLGRLICWQTWSLLVFVFVCNIMKRKQAVLIFPPGENLHLLLSLFFYSTWGFLFLLLKTLHKQKDVLWAIQLKCSLASNSSAVVKRSTSSSKIGGSHPATCTGRGKIEGTLLKCNLQLRFRKFITLWLETTAIFNGSPIHIEITSCSEYLFVSKYRTMI